MFNMAFYTFEISLEHNIYPNLTVYDRFRDGVHIGWKIEPNDSYVFFDTSEDSKEIDENGKETPVNYYFTVIYLPTSFDWHNFSLLAVPRNSVDEKYIFDHS